ncbi:hypothetical protein RYA99_23400 [Pseudomonas syringae pv. actinidifoliorum]|nr:hypothetical protein [Pseudomonas syringae pv. actinidifoliorum]
MIAGDFKEFLERTAKIRSWAPSSMELVRIESHLQALKASKRVITSTDIALIVARQCPGTQFFVTAGVDNKDISMLLTMALQQTKR